MALLLLLQFMYDIKLVSGIYLFRVIGESVSWLLVQAFIHMLFGEADA